MLSFGIEYERAFSIAFWSARLAAGSAPPSRAATMIARASLEKSLPRLASAAPFLCLIDDHLLCPDIGLLPNQLEEQFVDACVVGQFRVERRDENPAVAEQHRLAFELCEHLDAGAALVEPWGANEDAAQGLVGAVEPQVGLEARDLAPVGVAVDDDVGEPEVLPVEHDHPGAGAEHGPVEVAQRLVQAVEPDQAHDRGRFAAGNDEAVDLFELLRRPYLDRLRSQPAQHRRVLAEVSLDCQNADLHAEILGRETVLPTTRLEQLFGPQRGRRDADHRLAEPGGDAGQDLGVAVVRRRLDDRLAPKLGIA